MFVQRQACSPFDQEEKYVNTVSLLWSVLLCIEICISIEILALD